MKTKHTKEEINQVITFVRNLNPYPVDLFPEPEDSDWKEIGKFLQSHGKNPDRIFARFGRMVWENCINNFEEYFKS